MSEIAISEEREPFYTTRTLAERLAVSERQVKNWIHTGELVSYKLDGSRRIDPADVDSFLELRRDERRAA